MDKDNEVKTMTMPRFCPIGLGDDAEKLAMAISSYIYNAKVTDISALPTAMAILFAVETYALKGIDAACNELKERTLRYHSNGKIKDSKKPQSKPKKARCKNVV